MARGRLLLGDIVRRHARVRGAKTAYVLGDARVTYAEFHARSNRLARALRRLGVGRGDRVAILSGNVPEYPLLYFAAIKLGAILVPLNARFRAAEIAYVAQHSEAETLLAAAEFQPLVDELRRAGELPRLRHCLAIDGDGDGAPRLAELERAEPADDVDADIDEDDPHVMLYTSGTTGAAKGALLSHRSYYLQAAQSHLTTGLTEDDVGLSMFPMFHMGGWALPLGFWFNGSGVVIMPRADAREILAAVERERVTYLYAVPTVYDSMFALADFDRFDVSSLRLLGSGTSAMTRAQVEEIMARFRCRELFIFYGSTEAGPVTALRPRDTARKPETIGRPALNVDVRVVDAAGREVAAGETGEILVRSVFNLLGYWKSPEETAKTIGDGWVHTGDLASVDEEGFLSIVGRLKEVIRSGGENIFPAEVERVLLAHPDIREAALVGVPDAHWGEAAAAAIVPRAGAQLSPEDVAAHVGAQLAGFKKPRHVLFFDELPRTAASRQVQKPLLREHILARLRSPGG